ncbi:MAG: hypothetical protein GY874_06760 [Desulfobacteraceae bacterium]|nr:hypothetical protein [Desulfobacteraceae bacterium]
MKKLALPINNEQGMTLIVAILILVAVTALGLTSINITTTEINLVGNDKFQKVGFYNGDSGVHGTPSVIAPLLNDEGPIAQAGSGDPDAAACLEYLNYISPANPSAEFEDMIFVHMGTAGCDANQLAYKDISFRACDVNADIDICPTEAKALSGGGTEFAANAEGLGVGGGAKGNYFRITSTGDGASASTTYNVFGTYRWTEEAGGLK